MTKVESHHCLTAPKCYLGYNPCWSPLPLFKIYPSWHIESYLHSKWHNKLVYNTKQSSIRLLSSESGFLYALVADCGRKQSVGIGYQHKSDQTFDAKIKEKSEKAVTSGINLRRGIVTRCNPDSNEIHRQSFNA